ncbi:hypothetical protein M1D88_15895 [Arthrobacter sp. R1-13]
MLIWVLIIQVAFALAAGATLLLVPSTAFDQSWPQLAAAAFVVIEKIRAQGTADLIDTVLSTSSEWLRAVDNDGSLGWVELS